MSGPEDGPVVAQDNSTLADFERAARAVGGGGTGSLYPMAVDNDVGTLTGQGKNPPETSILIADDHERVRRGFREILEAEPGLHVVAEASNGREAAIKARETRPNVAVLDIHR